MISRIELFWTLQFLSFGLWDKLRARHHVRGGVHSVNRVYFVQDIADLNLLSIAIIQALGPSAPEFLLNVFRSIPGVGHEDAM